jgi:hypothetical protein
MSQLKLHFDSSLGVLFKRINSLAGLVNDLKQRCKILNEVLNIKKKSSNYHQPLKSMHDRNTFDPLQIANCFCDYFT